MGTGQGGIDIRDRGLREPPGERGGRLSCTAYVYGSRGASRLTCQWWRG